MTKVKFALVLVITFVIAQYLNASVNHGVWVYAVVTLPGTMLHELAHYLTAAAMGGNPGNFNLIPSGNTLGSITFTPNLYNAASVAMAPLLLAPLTAFFAAQVAKTNNPLKIGVGGYLSACAWVACTPSAQDFSIAVSIPTSWPIALLFLGLTTIALYKIVRRMLQ